MKDPHSNASADEKLTTIARELRTIRILLSLLVFLAATAMSYLIDRELPLVVFPIGLLMFIVWSMVDSFARRLRRARHEDEVFQRLSGKAERTNG